ncbi:hypothetical protein AYI69_g11386 [Smittium culicis]|uniref:Uncharacterized protein n=1 Tax=Smittium culicis TaxID=133412 RepID=A0A1R1WZ24_9FUNG|nr:hypothetical protein AYI69_g11386 [Smittium culicis]
MFHDTLIALATRQIMAETREMRNTTASSAECGNWTIGHERVQRVERGYCGCQFPSNEHGYWQVQQHVCGHAEKLRDRRDERWVVQARVYKVRFAVATATQSHWHVLLVQERVYANAVVADTVHNRYPARDYQYRRRQTVDILDIVPRKYNYPEPRLL